MTKLSVNINKVATLRNARGGNNPCVTSVALDCERFGAQGITVHPRPDERHIRYQDVRDLKGILTTEFNIEGFPCADFCDLVCEVQPAQVTLVPDAPNQLTSNHGWQVGEHTEFLTEVIRKFKDHGIRTSVFIDAQPEMVERPQGSVPTEWNFIRSRMLSIMPPIARRLCRLLLRRHKNAERLASD